MTRRCVFEVQRITNDNLTTFHAPLIDNSEIHDGIIIQHFYHLKYYHLAKYWSQQEHQSSYRSRISATLSCLLHNALTVTSVTILSVPINSVIGRLHIHYLHPASNTLIHQHTG